MELIDIKSATITEKNQIVLPKEMQKQKGFQKGAKVVITAYKDRIEIKPIKKINDALLTARISEKSLAKEWNNKAEDTAWKNL
jgi:AbrB family looped-hinge helix DNA binding protein